MLAGITFATHMHTITGRFERALDPAINETVNRKKFGSLKKKQIVQSYSVFFIDKLNTYKLMKPDLSMLITVRVGWLLFGTYAKSRKTMKPTKVCHPWNTIGNCKKKSNQLIIEDKFFDAFIMSYDSLLTNVITKV